MHVDVESQLGVLVALFDQTMHFTQVAEAGQTHHAGTLVEQGVQFVHAHVGVANQVEDDGRIDVAGTATHHEAFQRGSDPWRSQPACRRFRGGGSTVADVQHDLLEAFGRLADDGRHDGGDELVGVPWAP